MIKTYKEIYKELIGEKFNSILISYEPQKGKYKYCGYSHRVESEALDDLANLIIDDIVFYAFSENEILRLNDNINILDDLRCAAQYAYIERLPKRTYAKTDGTLGEVLLDIIVQLDSLGTQKLVARAKHTEIQTKKEITGYDALYFTKDGNEICWWLGQAKAGEKDYCKKDIAKDLCTKYTKEYFSNTAFYIADKNEAPELDDLLCRINGICYMAQVKKWDSKKKVEKLFELLKMKNVKIKIPCLISYSLDIYTNSTKLKEYIEAEIKEFLGIFDNHIFPIEIEMSYDIVFYVVPVKSVNYIRNKIIDMKRESI